MPNLQVGGQVVQFLASHGFPIPSSAVVNRIGDGFRRAVRSFANANSIPIIKFVKGDRKIEKMQPYLARQEESGRSGVAAIGWAQDFQRVATCTTTEARNGGAPHFSWDRGIGTRVVNPRQVITVAVRCMERPLGGRSGTGGFRVATSTAPTSVMVHTIQLAFTLL